MSVSKSTIKKRLITEGLLKNNEIRVAFKFSIHFLNDVQICLAFNLHIRVKSLMPLKAPLEKVITQNGEEWAA